MNSIIEKIITIANDLDDNGNEAIASALDSLAEKITDIKVAQYVGSQGYWVRNSRCWANCYREKRANNPDMPAQKVWTSCHEEYVTAMQNQNLGKSTSSWDKYASSDQKNIISALDVQFNEHLSSFIKKNIEAGMDRGHAIFAAIDDMEMQPYDDLIEASQQAFDLASKMFEKSPREAVKIAQAGEELIKEAQWWQRSMPGRALNHMWNPSIVDPKSQGALQSSISKLQKAMQTLLQERTNIVQLANQSGLNQIAEQINSQLPDASFMQLSEGITAINTNFQNAFNVTKGNPIERGMNWLNQQGQSGADKARKFDEFSAAQQGQQGQQQQAQPQPDGMYDGSQTRGQLRPDQQSRTVGQNPQKGQVGITPGEFLPEGSQPVYNRRQPSPYVQDNTSNISGTGFDNRLPEQMYSDQEDPMAKHAPYIQPILQLAPNKKSLDILFDKYIQQKGGVLKPRNYIANSSNKIKKESNSFQNNEGIMGEDAVDKYLRGLDVDSLSALYNYLLSKINQQNQQNQQNQHMTAPPVSEGYGGSILGPTLNSQSSSNRSTKRHVRASREKTFNLSKFNDRGDK